ncbi:FUSC family protein [Paenibacillus gallinarum]|uniref:FUSC family protein n=1 Tax=Paenibacillus gallinarum TaxID=2762232 RepID=A0ABR8T0Z9_9BACL|nr:FUSC family protein [Paenibacillus gallinarum]MBD7969444.1 FUSC family protein [Paenibacillus gallinarum]
MNNHNAYSSRRRAKHTFPKRPMYKEAFQIKPIPLNWFRGVGSAISVGTPALLGVLMGNPALGILASIGGFTFLYVSNETYAQRAVRLFWVALGLAVSFALGALCSYNTILTVLMFGIVGGLSTLMFTLFQITGPSGMFFVLAYAVGTSMTANLNVILHNSLILFLGGMFAWMVGMAGVIMNPHRTESKASSAVYYSLANLLSAVGTAQFTDLQHQTASLMQQADRTLMNSKWFGRKDKPYTEKLRVLNTQAREIFLSILDISLMPKHEVEEQLSSALQIIGDQLLGKENEVGFAVPTFEDELNLSLKNLYLNIKVAFEISSTNAIDYKTDPKDYKTKTGFRVLLKNVFTSGSNAPFIALRYGIILVISAAIAYGFHFDRSYWVPLSSASVMGGATYVASLHRGIQRSLGTIIGIIVGAILLWLHPQYVAVPLILASLQFVVELIYGRNYSLAVIFITPSTLLIGSTLQPELTSEYFISARIVDIIIGSAVAMVGITWLWRKTASKRLPSVFKEAVEREGELLVAILNCESIEVRKSIEEKLQNALIQLRLVYDNAFAESMRRNARTTILWPAVGDSLHLGYMLLAASRNDNNINHVSSDRIEKYQHGFAVLAESIENNKKPVMDMPALPEFPSIYEDIMQLKRSLRVLDSSLNLTRF